MKNLSKNMTLAAALTLAMTALCGSAMAQDAVAAPAAAEAVPDNVVSYNVALTSDYRYRGISQSRLKPAISGGADYTHNPTGLYVGTWLSSIKWIKDGGGDTNLEWDVYGGKRGEISKDFTYDVGGLPGLYTTDQAIWNLETGPCQIRSDRGGVERIYNLTARTLSFVGNGKAVSEGRDYTLADGAPVYELRDKSYYLTDLSRVNNGSFTLTGWQDKAETAGGRIRVIVAQAK